MPRGPRPVALEVLHHSMLRDIEFNPLRRMRGPFPQATSDAHQLSRQAAARWGTEKLT